MSVMRMAVLAVAFIASGCASIVSDNDSTTYIESVPQKAHCELHGQDFVRVLDTPGSIQLPANAAPITIACKADKYLNTTYPLDTEADGWILGNIIFGGGIGIIIDAVRGAGERYPPKVTVILEPEVFASKSARDEWFDRRRAASEAIWEKRIQNQRTECENDFDCDAKVDRVKKARDEDLAKLEERRLRANVSGTGTPAAGPKT